jgi:uncharacterized protein with ParB-like and HNH nuclease domain
MEIERPYEFSDELPYNPSDVDIRQMAVAIDFVIQKIETGDIDLWNKNDFQRSGGLWSIEKKSRFIESLIMRIPIPIFYFDGSQKTWKIIDGLQRLTTLYQFIHENGFKLKNLEYLKQLEYKSFNELPFSYQRVIENSVIQAYVVNPGTPEKVKLNIFQRINTGGEGLTPQEIRNAYYRGKPYDFINELSKSREFLEATNYKISTKRMRDDEIVLRFFTAFRFFKLYQPPMDKFLDYSMAYINEMSDGELDEIKDRFKISMNTCKNLFGNNAFTTKISDDLQRKQPINISLFESWSTNIAKLNSSEIARLINNKGMLLHEYGNLLLQPDFYKSISSGTSSKGSFYNRFNRINELIKNTISC